MVGGQSSLYGYTGHPYGLTSPPPGLVGAPAVHHGYLASYAPLGVNPYFIGQSLSRSFHSSFSGTGHDQPLDLSVPLNVPTYHTVPAAYDPNMLALTYGRPMAHTTTPAGRSHDITSQPTTDPSIGPLARPASKVRQVINPPTTSIGPFLPSAGPSGLRVTHSPLVDMSRTTAVPLQPRATPRILTTPPQRGTPSPPLAEPLIPEDDPGLGGPFMGYPAVTSSDSPPSPAPGSGKQSVTQTFWSAKQSV